MNVLNRLTIRNLRLNKKRTIVTIIGIILSGAMICGVAAIIASFQDLFIQSAMISDGNYHATFYDVPYEDTKYIVDNAYTQESLLSRDAGYAILEGSKNDTKPYLFIKEYDHKAFYNMPITLIDGRFPERNGEIIISEEVIMGAGVDYEIGDSITLSIGDRMDEGIRLTQEPFVETEVLDIYTTKRYTITGFIQKPRFERYESPGFTSIAYLDTKSLDEGESVNVSILAAKPRKIFEKVPEMAEAIGVENIAYNNELLRWQGISNNDAINSMWWSIGIIIILLVVIGSVTVIYNAFAISVSERKKQFGMLSSVGATSSQIRKMVFFEGLILGIIAIPLGIVSGIAGIGITLNIVNKLMLETMINEDITLRLVISPMVIIITIFFVALTIFLSAFIPAKRASGISPVEAIRLNTDIRIKGKKLRTSKLTRLLFGIEGELALKNLKRNRRRYRATLFSLFISIVLFISFSSFMTYGFRSTNMYYGDIPYNLRVESQHENHDEKMEFYNKVAGLDGVEQYSIVRTLNNEAKGLDKSQFGDYLLKNYLEQGTYYWNDDGTYTISVNITSTGYNEFERFARENGLDPADYLNVDNPRGILVNKGMDDTHTLAEFEPLSIKAGEEFKLSEWKYNDDHTPYSYSLEIGAVVDTQPFGVDHSWINSINIIVSDEVFESIYENMHEEIRRWSNSPTLNINAEDPAKLEAEVKTIHDQMLNGYINIWNISAMQQEMKNTKTVIAIFLYGFITLITLIGVTNIFNTISTNVALRRREFAMLKSVGLTPGGFNKMINYESIFYGLKALLYGLPVGTAISVLMYNSFGHVFDFKFALPWNGIAFCIIGVFVLVFITMLYSSSKIKKENIIDALKEENL